MSDTANIKAPRVNVLLPNVAHPMWSLLTNQIRRTQHLVMRSRDSITAIHSARLEP